MRYEDASHTGAFQGQGPIANDDLELVAAGQKSSATGNLITGEGTQSGSAGADSAAGAHITAIAGKSGEDSSFSGGKLSVAGEYGKLSVDAEGNYVYQANKGVENVRDRFTYTLADNQGATDSASLIVEIGKTPVVIKANAQQIVPGPDGVVTLPPGVELSDVHVVGRNLVIDMPDGTQLIIIDGAVFVPQLVVNGVEVPATNVAALLVGQEIQPAAGELPPSSGGNFAVPPPPLDPGVPLGDLIPPTVYVYKPPEPQEVLQPEDSEPEILIQPDGQPAAVAAVDSVDEKGLPTRNGGEPEGSGEEAAAGANGDPSEATAGTIIIDSPDGVDSVTITDGNGVAHEIVVGLVIQGDYGTLTITGIVGSNYTYSYVLNDNISHSDANPDHDDFTVTLTDNDGDQATATLQIDIIDDVPTARPDTDALAIGQASATGNVLTDAAAGDAGDSDNGRDTMGADNATVTLVSSANVPANSDNGAPFVVNGQYGVLTLQANGDYVYTRNPDSPGGVQDVFNYTITDGDGDTSSTTLTITIPDALPNLPDPDAVLLDDDALANGNPGGVGDNVDSQGTPGQLNGTGGDGDLDYAFTGSNTLPAGFTVNVVNASTVQILQGATVVLTVTLNNETGAFTVVQNAPINHPAGLDENNLSFSIGVQVVDADGDTEGAAITINVDDDTPIALEAQVTGTVDEDGVPGGIAGGTGDVAGESTVANGSVASLFASGADTPLTYSLLSNTSGLPALTSGGVAVTYSVVGNTLTASAGGNTVFTFVLQSNGSWTFTLVDQLDHAAGNNENDLTIQLGSIIQATDNDGDSVTANASGLVITVDDDTPTASGAQVTGTVDEDGVPGGIAGGPADVAGESTVANGSVSTLFNSGADQPLSYSLNTDTSGLPALTSAGVAITYQVVGNTLTASAGGNTVFTLTLNANGTWTFTLVDQIDHPTLNGLAGDDTENDLAIDLSSLIKATDADGDSVTASAGGLVITVDDDTPVANNDVDSVPAGGDIATGNVITGANTDSGGAGADSPGADAPASITALAGSVTSDSNPAGGFVAQGTYGVLTMQADGSYSYDRNDGAPGNVQDVFTYTYTDRDGDSVTATLTININDSAPTAGTVNATLDDETLANGIPGGVGDQSPDTSNLTGNLPGSGGDGTLTFGVLLTGAPAGFTYVSGGAGIVLIQQGGVTKITVTVNANGSYTIVQNAPIDHAPGGNENDQAFSLTYTVTDADNDQATGTININVDDDTPTASATQLTGTVDEDGVPGGIAGGTGDVAGEVTSATGNVSSLFNSGADTPLTYQLLGNFAGLPNLTSHGVAVTYAVVLNAGVYTLTASAGGSTVFTFTLNATTGAYNFTLVDQLDHAAGNNENDLTINLSSIIQATDHDGDSVVAGTNGLIITVDDDTPTATATQLTGTVDEDGVVENGAVGIQYGDGIPGGTGDVAGEIVSATGSVATLFNSGADAPLTYQMLNNFAALNALNLTSGGAALSYGVVLNAGVYTLTATAGGQTIFTFTLNATTGAYNFTLVDQLDHPTLNGLTGDNTENDLAINLSSLIQATDADGDTVAAGANALIITVDDDSPLINSVTSPLAIDNDATPSGTGNFDFDIGADENSDHDDITVSNFTVSVNGVAVDPADVTFTAGAENATTASYTFSFDYDTGTGGTATANGTLVFDKVAGTYTVELTNGPIEGFSLLATGSADASAFVSYQVPAGGSGAPEVTVAALDTDFFVQFSGVAEPGSGTGGDNLTTTTGAGGAFNPVTTANFAGLELFTQAMSTVQVSNTAAGVAGNTIQGGEVLDLNLYATDPGGTIGGVPTQTSTSMFMTLDGIGTSEDMIVVLKLLDTSTGQYTTKAIIVQNGDILTDADAASLVGTPYEGVAAALDNNDGLIVIEANDYQEGNTNLVIVGAQIAGSDEGITGTGINLNGDVGAGGGSSGTQSFATDVSDAPFKITSIGFLTTSTEDQSATLNFDVTIEDADGDAVTQNITVDIGSSSPALLPPDPQSFSTQSTESLLVSDSGDADQQLQKTAANSNTLTLSAAVAAAGLVETEAAASLPDESSHGQDVSEVAASVGPAVQDVAGDAGEESRSALANEAREAADDVAPAASSGHSDASASSDHSLDDSHASAPANSNESAANDDQGPADASADASPAAQSVAMVSAEALQAADLDGNVQHGGSVEQIVADALGHGNAPATVDALLSAIHGGNGGGSEIANLASPAAGAVSGWDMASNGGSAGANEMLMKVGAEMLHHDAVQPTHNG